MFRYIFMTIFIFSILSANDNDKIKELESWLRFGFTNGDVAFIAEYISEIEHKNYILEKRITNLENGLIEQNRMINTLLMKKNEAKKTPAKKTKKITRFKPSLFITKTVALIYDAPNGKSNMKFPPNYKFTAFERTGEWIRVSGHFPFKKWKKIKKSAWIKEKLVRKIR